MTSPPKILTNPVQLPRLLCMARGLFAQCNPSGILVFVKSEFSKNVDEIQVDRSILVSAD
jgi:hypothetical protein